MNNNRLQKWALAAEIIGGLAVVVTLVFLVIETRNNTNSIQAQTYQNLTEELNQTRRDQMDPVIARIFVKAREEGFDALNPEERYLAAQVRSAKWGVYESAFYARERNVLGEFEWVRFQEAICRNLNVDAKDWMPVGGGPGIKTILTPRFSAYVESSCEWEGNLDD